MGPSDSTCLARHFKKKPDLRSTQVMADAIVNASDVASFKAEVEKDRLTVVHFWASWAVQCEPMDEAMTILAAELPHVGFIRVEAETVPEVSMEHEVAAVPTFIFFRQNKVLDRIEGAKAADTSKRIRELAKQDKAGPDLPKTTLPKADKPKEPLDERLKKLVNSSKCILFMKGDPVAPRCGFSRQTVELLNSLNAEYATFDILGDEEVRQGLKTFLNWPTYPQLYIDGEFIGGIDIMKEMNESNELEPVLPKKKDLNTTLKSLINKAPLMVFMKGDPETPKCGFSNQLMHILKEVDLPFSTFDILSDEEVRQGLKKFSDWPTYPQVYVNGELIGGLDIIKDLKESGDLVTTLKGQ